MIYLLKNKSKEMVIRAMCKKEARELAVQLTNDPDWNDEATLIFIIDKVGMSEVICSGNLECRQ